MDFTDRLLSSSFLGLPYRILNMNHEKKLLRSLWVGPKVCLAHVLGPCGSGAEARNPKTFLHAFLEPPIPRYIPIGSIVVPLYGS